MKRTRIMWAIWLFLMIPAVVFTENPAIPVIAVLSLILPAMGILLAAFSARGLEADMQSAVSVPKGEVISYSLDVVNSGRWACAKGRAVLVAENLFTGRQQEMKFSFSVAGRGHKRITADIATEECGMVKVHLKSLESCDFIGAYSKAAAFAKTAQTLVLPETFHTRLDMGAGTQMDLESSEYSMLKPGFDPSETFALREYRAGDSLKNIHWKLSGKLDELTVREPGLPINNTVLILLDTSNQEPNREKISPVVADAIGEAVISLAQELCYMQIPYQLGWYDRQQECMCLREVTKEEQLSTAMADLLSQRTEYDELSIAEHFTAEYGKPEYAHVIITGTHEDAVMRENLSDGIVTDLVCRESAADCAMADAGQIIYFTPETMTEDLLYLEV